MTPKYFDIHSHLNFSDYEKDWDEVIGRLRETGTYTIAVGTDYESSKRAVELAEKYEEIYACIGVHPVDNPAENFDITKYEELAKHPKVVAIGECGLDFHHVDKGTDFERQKKLFITQIDFAVAHNKPLMIHARDAYSELLDILEPLKETHGERLRGNVHFFAGDLEISKRFFAIGFTVSFTGVITFPPRVDSPRFGEAGERQRVEAGTHDYIEVIKSAPLDMIMSETDAPYVAPVPYRGKRNEPSYVTEVVKRIAVIRGEDLEFVRLALVNNALSMIG